MPALSNSECPGVVWVASVDLAANWYASSDRRCKDARFRHLHAMSHCGSDSHSPSVFLHHTGWKMGGASVELTHWSEGSMTKMGVMLCEEFAVVLQV